MHGLHGAGHMLHYGFIMISASATSMSKHTCVPHAEAHAALAAVEWASGQKGLAEDHFDKAVTLDGRWSKMGYIRQQTRWPPALYQAMERFLSIASVDDDRISS